MGRGVCIRFSGKKTSLKILLKHLRGEIPCDLGKEYSSQREQKVRRPWGRRVSRPVWMEQRARAAGDRPEEGPPWWAFLSVEGVSGTSPPRKGAVRILIRRVK